LNIEFLSDVFLIGVMVAWWVGLEARQKLCQNIEGKTSILTVVCMVLSVHYNLFYIQITRLIMPLTF
jgi:hypothetical protein